MVSAPQRARRLNGQNLQPFLALSLFERSISQVLLVYIALFNLSALLFSFAWQVLFQCGQSNGLYSFFVFTLEEASRVLLCSDKFL